MRGFYTAFPDGAGGIGLVLLRTSILFDLSAYAASAIEQPWLAPLWAVTVALTTIGFLAPIAAAACCACHCIWFFTGVQQDVAWLIGSGLTSAALGLLGPGAYSLDAKLFGRRRVFADGDRKP